MLMAEWNMDDALAVRYEEGCEEERKKWQGVVAERDAALADQAAALAEKDAQIADQAAQIAELRAKLRL